ncbi:MAG: hypothetical protein CM15mP115_16580 [Alphaproteobacteria bacterium]|nr:MAG: hypothetical protein CM15mP115_16580 [Alphaproteobacteria bacterium]
MAERPNGDFAHTILRQFFFAAYMNPFWRAMTGSVDRQLAAHAGKAVKETAYHIRHSGEWVIRLGDGTEESAYRMATALDDLAPYIGEMFETDETASRLIMAGVLPDPAPVRAAFEDTVAQTFAMATMPPFEVQLDQRWQEWPPYRGLGHLLAEMQQMQRAYPGLKW